MEANAGLVAGSYKKNQLVVIGPESQGVRCFSSLSLSHLSLSSLLFSLCLCFFCGRFGKEEEAGQGGVCSYATWRAPIGSEYLVSFWALSLSLSLIQSLLLLLSSSSELKKQQKQRERLSERNRASYGDLFILLLRNRLHDHHLLSFLHQRDLGPSPPQIPPTQTLPCGNQSFIFIITIIIITITIIIIIIIIIIIFR